QNGMGYDLVLLGQNEPLTVDADQLQERLARPDHTAVAHSIEEVGFQTVVGLLASYAGRTDQLRPWLENAAINRDRNLRLQYLPGMNLNNNQSKLIYDELQTYRHFPTDIFIGTGWRSMALKVAIERTIPGNQ